jgi:hypothetical protein
MKKLTGKITLSSGVMVSDNSLVDSLEGICTLVWNYDLMACPQMIVQLYKWPMTVNMNPMIRR